MKPGVTRSASPLIRRALRDIAYRKDIVVIDRNVAVEQSHPVDDVCAAHYQIDIAHSLSFTALHANIEGAP